MTVLVADGIDAGVPWHFGDPMREQRRLVEGEGAVDLSHRGVLTVTGPDRLTWLHSLTTQHLTALQPGQGITALVLSPQGHIEHALYGVDDGETFWAHTEPGAAAALVAWLDSMRFMMRVEAAERSSEYGIVWQPGEQSVDHVTRAGLDSLGGFETSSREHNWTHSWLIAHVRAPGRTRP
jgi:folate-binding Fe-S cluster repair protein YgfZ